MNIGRIGLIGFGEAASAFVAGWRSENDVKVATYDILFDDPADKGKKRAQCLAHGVEAAASAKELAAQSDLVFSAVTAEQALNAARSAVPGAHAGLVYFDINSAAPFRKREASELLAKAGIGYVDVAVMAPVHPKLHKTPLLISGPEAARMAPVLEALGMAFELVSDKVGDASTIKMIRSVAIKGIESVVMECVVAAVKLGVADRVLPSVASAYSQVDFAKRMDYMLERVAVHGKRRAEEMREVAATLEHAGVTSYTAAATARQQQHMADLGLKAALGGQVPEDARRIARVTIDLLEAASRAGNDARARKTG